MANGGALDLTSHLGGKIQKDDVLDAVDKYTYIPFLSIFVFVCISELKFCGILMLNDHFIV